MDGFNHTPELDDKPSAEAFERLTVTKRVDDVELIEKRTRDGKKIPPSGKTLEQVEDPDDTVKEHKRRLQTKEGIPEEQQRLLFPPPVDTDDESDVDDDDDHPESDYSDDMEGMESEAEDPVSDTDLRDWFEGDITATRMLKRINRVAAAALFVESCPQLIQDFFLRDYGEEMQRLYSQSPVDKAKCFNQYKNSLVYALDAFVTADSYEEGLTRIYDLTYPSRETGARANVPIEAGRRSKTPARKPKAVPSADEIAKSKAQHLSWSERIKQIGSTFGRTYLPYRTVVNEYDKSIATHIAFTFAMRELVEPATIAIVTAAATAAGIGAENAFGWVVTADTLVKSVLLLFHNLGWIKSLLGRTIPTPIGRVFNNIRQLLFKEETSSAASAPYTRQPFFIRDALQHDAYKVIEVALSVWSIADQHSAMYARNEALKDIDPSLFVKKKLPEVATIAAKVPQESIDVLKKFTTDDLRAARDYFVADIRGLPEGKIPDDCTAALLTSKFFFDVSPAKWRKNGLEVLDAVKLKWLGDYIGNSTEPFDYLVDVVKKLCERLYADIARFILRPLYSVAFELLENFKEFSSKLYQKVKPYIGPVLKLIMSVMSSFFAISIVADLAIFGSISFAAIDPTELALEGVTGVLASLLNGTSGTIGFTQLLFQGTFRSGFLLLSGYPGEAAISLGTTVAAYDYLMVTSKRFRIVIGLRKFIATHCSTVWDNIYGTKKAEAKAAPALVDSPIAKRLVDNLADQRSKQPPTPKTSYETIWYAEFHLAPVSIHEQDTTARKAHLSKASFKGKTSDELREKAKRWVTRYHTRFKKYPEKDGRLYSLERNGYSYDEETLLASFNLDSTKLLNGEKYTNNRMKWLARNQIEYEEREEKKI